MDERGLDVVGAAFYAVVISGPLMAVALFFFHVAGVRKSSLLERLEARFPMFMTHVVGSRLPEPPPTGARFPRMYNVSLRMTRLWAAFFAVLLAVTAVAFPLVALIAGTR